MKFEDLTVFDLNLIRSQAIHVYVDKSVNRYEALFEVLSSCIHAKGFKFDPFFKDFKNKVLDAVDWRSAGSSLEILKHMFDAIEKFSSIVLNEGHVPTWPIPKDSWYNRVDSTKKPWVF